MHDAVHVVMSGETTLDFTAKSDGHATTVAGNPAFDQVQMRRIDRRQSEVQEQKNGAVTATVREKLSKDGNELTITTTRTGHADEVTVWNRSGGTRSAREPLAGDWTEDQSKTLMRQGLTLRFEPDGSNGVRFSGDSSYAARFDGRQYDLRNSRNDTVALQLVDPHTVHATYRRDDQVTQQDDWTVSADGQQMTLKSTGTLETGQRVSENLMFRRR